MARAVIRVPSSRRLQRVIGKSPLFDFLELTNTFDFDVFRDPSQFMGDTLFGGYQSTASGGGSATAAIDAGKVGGQIVLDAGTTNGGRSDLSLGLHFQGQLNATIAALVSIDDITDAKVEVGFTDVISGTDAGAVDVKATPTFNALDCALWVFDTTDNTDWEGISTPDGDTTPPTVIEAGIQPVAGTSEWLIVALRDDTVTYIRATASGGVTFTSTPQLLGPTKTTLLTPWAFVQNRAGAKTKLSIRDLWVWQRKTTG